MHILSVPALFLATPALAHPAALPHAHPDWPLPAGLCLIAVAGVLAWRRARAKLATVKP